MTRTSRSRTLKAPEFRARGRGPITSAGLPTGDPDRTGMRTRPGWRVIIADSSEARIYAAGAAASHLTLLATLRNPSARIPEQELLTGRGGSRFNRSGGHYQALAPTSRVHRERFEQFAKTIATVAARECGTTEQLALIAAPRLLGLIQRAMSGSARARLARAVPRDVTHESAARLRTRLQRELGSTARA